MGRRRESLVEEEAQAFAYSPGGSRAREGYVSSVSAHTYPLQRRQGIMYLPNTFWTWTFTLVTLIQGLAVIGLEA